MAVEIAQEASQQQRSREACKRYNQTIKGKEAQRRSNLKRYAFHFHLKTTEKAKPCADCGVQYPYYVMDFDHVRGTKKFNLGVAALRGGKRTLLAEIAKCEVVCSNCHRERTHKRRTEDKNGN